MRPSLNLLCCLLLSMGLIEPALAEAEPAPAPPKKARLVLLDFASHGVEPATVSTIAAVVSSAFAAHPALDVVTASDLRALVDIESARQRSDCDQGADACMADIAAALGADLVVHGSVGALGDLTIVNMSIFDAAQNSAVAREKVQSNHAADLSLLLEGAVNRLAASIGAAQAPPTTAESPVTPVLVLVGGAGVAVVGVTVSVLGGLGALSSFGVLEDPASLRGAKDDASASYPLLLSTAIGGGVLAAAGVGLVVGSQLIGDER